jgi:hypothetical protein
MRDDPRVPEDLRQHAARALEGIAAASLWIDTLRAIARSSDTLHEFANVRPRVHSLALRERKAESA